MTEIEKAYLAGIVDGEGCIGVYRRKRYILPTLQITNTNWELIAWLQAVCSKGSVYNTKEKRTNRKVCWTWRVSAAKATTILRDVMPYLVVKRCQAELICALHRRYHDRSRRLDSRGRLRGHLTDDQLQENDRIYQGVRLLNARGRVTANATH